MARLAVDSYLEAVNSDRYTYGHQAAGAAERAREIALQLRDEERAKSAIEALFALEDRIAVDDSPGLWGMAFDLMERGDKRVSLTGEQEAKALGDMEARLARLSAHAPYQYVPTAPKAAATRLARYYVVRGRRDEVARVLNTYRDIVLKMRGTAAPMVAAHAIEELYELYREYHLFAEADQLSEPLRVENEAAVNEYTTIEETVEVPRDKVEAALAQILAHDDASLQVEVAVQFVPRRAALEELLQRLAQKAPMQFLITQQIKDETGRTVAQIGPLESDPEGHLIHQVTQQMMRLAGFLRELLQRGIAQGKLSVDGILAHLLQSPVFTPSREPLLRRGLEAWAAGDHVTALHVLIPQVEHALRNLAQLVGTPLYRPGNTGGFNARMLGDLLRDLRPSLGDDTYTYLLALLADGRGWNLRNDVCHGLAPAGEFNFATSDRVLHSLLLLALIRLTPSGTQEAEPHPSATPPAVSSEENMS